MLDIEQELKALKRYGMAAAYAEITSSEPGYLKIRLRPLVKFQPVSVVSFHPASTDSVAD